MKKFINNAFVHWAIVTIFAALTQYLTSSGKDAVTVGALIHGIYEYLLSNTSVGIPPSQIDNS